MVMVFALEPLSAGEIMKEADVRMYLFVSMVWVDQWFLL